MLEELMVNFSLWKASMVQYKT